MDRDFESPCLRRFRAASAALLVSAMLLSGCAGNKPTPATQPALASDVTLLSSLGRPSLVYQEVLPGEKPLAKDYLRAQLDVVQVSAPLGTVTANTAFWEIVSDRLLSPADQRFLRSNGVRMGLVEVSAWPQLKTMMEAQGNVVSRSSNILGSGRAELDPNHVPAETLFYYTRSGQLEGRTFDESENFWGVSFSPSIEHGAGVKVELCPVVRTARRYLEFSKANTERELTFVRPESIYDVGLRVEVPVGMLLVVAPTEAALRTSTSVGGAFLIRENESGLREQILVFYPRLYRFNEEATAHRAESLLNNQPPAPTTAP